MNQSPPPVHPDVALAIEFYRSAFPTHRPKTVGPFLTAYAAALEASFEARHGFVFTLSRNWDPDHREREEDSFFRRRITPDKAKLITAREHGYGNWQEVEEAGGETLDDEFELAADDVVHGRIDSLKQRLSSNPNLVKAKSSFGHRATLLHYLAANGVEMRRQLSPSNAAEVAELLLTSGSEPDAIAETYGGGSAQSTLCLLVTSEHPHRANVSTDLIKVLLKHGGNIEGIDGDGLPLRICMLHGYSSSLDTLVAEGAAVDDLYSAAATGDLAKVDALIEQRTWPEIRRVAWTYAFSRDKAEQANGDVYSILQRSIELADLHGRHRVVERLQSIREAYTAALDQFDEAWSELPAPPLRRFVPAEVRGAFAQRLICDLINIDLDYRWSALANHSTADSSVADTDIPPSDVEAHDKSQGIGKRPRIEDYYAPFPEVMRFKPIPLFLIKEEFRVRFEAGNQPTPAEYIDRFPDYADLLPEQLENVLKEEGDLFPTLTLDIYHKNSKVFSTPFAAPLEIGRRRPEEPAPYVVVDTDEGRRLIIADLRERFMSRKHLLLEPLPSGRVKAKNLSDKNAILMPMHLEKMAPGDTREFIPPIKFVVQTKTIRITISE